MKTSLLRSRTPIALAGLLGLSLVVAPMLSATTQNEKTVYLSVVDQEGHSVTNLTRGDVLIREDNMDREVVDVKRATDPMAIVILADTSKEAGARGLMDRQDTISGAVEIIRDMRKALTSFVQVIHAGSPESKMELMEFGQASITITKMTSKVEDLQKGILRLFPKPDASSVLLESIVEASKHLSKESAPRKLIVILTVEPADEQSRQQRTMNEEIDKARASVWGIALQRGTLSNSMHGIVLTDLAKNTGGRHETLMGQAALESTFMEYADNLLSQYAVTYRRPAGETPRLVQVGVIRQGVKLHANIFAPK